MDIVRSRYLNQLIDKQESGMVKVITGLRRCGKSYLLFTQFKRYLLQNGIGEEQIIEASFDTFEDKIYRDAKVFYDYVKQRLSKGGRFYILLDEVQELEDFEAVLNGLLRQPNVDIYVTGSNARFLSKDVLTEFSGRGDEIHLRPLNFTEFMSAYDGDAYHGWNEYILHGGLPPVILQKSEVEKERLLANLLRETYIKDIAHRHGIRNKGEFTELFSILASGIGSLTNPRKLSATFKSVKNISISVNTIRRYIEYMSDAFLLNAAQRYDIKGKRYIDTPLKYYFTDLGLRNAQTSFRQLEETHLMENALYNELLLRGYNVDVGVVPVTETDKNNKQARKQLEIDFVCNKGSKRYYIQSAFAMPGREKVQQEQKSLLKIRDAFKKIIIVKDTPRPWYTEEGILVVGLFDFLLNANCLEEL